MIDDLKSCSVCGTRLASKWSKGDLVHYCAYCAVAECSDDAPALREIVALRARAEAAEQRAEALAAELAQARADARVLAGIAYGLEECCWVEDRLAPAGLTDAEADALRGAFDAAYRLPDAEVVAVIRRAIGGAA